MISFVFNSGIALEPSIWIEEVEGFVQKGDGILVLTNAAIESGLSC